MKRFELPLLIAVGLASSSAFGADMPVKAPPMPAAAASPWDVAITAALMTDYNFRGISQSDHKPSTQAGFEPRYNISKDVQLYAGLSGESIDFPNHAAAEIDLYGGIRPTFGKLALDFGGWYYYYPGGVCHNAAVAGCLPSLLNGNVIKADLSFVEAYAKATYTVNDNLSLGLQEWYSPSVLNSGADGWFTTGNVTLTAPANLLPNGIGFSVSGDVGYWALGTSDSFYAVAGFPGGIPYKSYWTWDAGMDFTYKIFTLDLRYYDSDLNKGDCNAFTSDQTASGVFSTPINPGGPGSNWCGAAFIAKLSAAVNLSGLK